MADESLPIPRQLHLKERASGEFKAFLVIFLYLWVVFGLLFDPQEPRFVTASFGLPRARLCDHQRVHFCKGSACRRAFSPWNAV